MIFFQSNNQSYPCHSTQTVIHKEAPTADSARLLKELEEKAIAKLEATLKIDDNSFKCSIQFYWSPMDMTIHAIANFDLNGKRHRANVKTEQSSNKQEMFKEAVSLLRDEVAKIIATEMIKDSFETSNWKEILR